MALKKKPIKGSGIIKLKDTISSNDGTTVNIVETWTGPYAELKIKQDSVILAMKATSLNPTEAGEGELKLTRELGTTPDFSFDPGEKEVIEVLWQELRQPIQLSPFFDDMPPFDMLEVLAGYEDPAYEPGDNTLKQKLYNDLVRGQEYVSAVPLVRQTDKHVPGGVGSGNAWYRDDPPVSVDGDWEFMKSADERRREGRSTSRIQEWLGAKVWDPDHYPSPSDGPPDPPEP